MIRNIICERTAGRALTAIFLLTILFHLAAIFGFVPIDMIWGGRLKTREELYVFESISIALNVIMLWIVASRMDYVKVLINRKVIRVIL